jgi:branched-chain amino acid transport system substrate-binding protein
MSAPIKIGIFLPFSRSNPLASANIAAGIKAGFSEEENHEFEVINYTVTSNRRLIVENLMRAFIVDEIDIAIANIGYCSLPQVLAELKLTDKILFLTSVGADIVREGDRHPLVFRNSLMYWQSLYLTGYETCKKHGPVFTATTTLETGYDSYLAYLCGIEDAGGDVTHFHQCDERDYIFRAQPCIDKIESVDYAAVAALASGDNALKIYNEVISKLRPRDNRNIILSPFFHENPVAKQLGSILNGTRSYFGWADSLFCLGSSSTVCGRFMNSWSSASRKNPDAFSILGYETARMICESLDKCDWKTDDAQQIAHALSNVCIESPRGYVLMDAKTHTVNAPVYLREYHAIDGNPYTRPLETSLAPKDSDAALNARISLHASRWLQDYLFS